MIITLKGADFSANNIGTLSSWTVSRVLGTGATYSGATSVDKGAALSATITISDGYALSSAGVTVTMGGVTQSSAYSISGSTITISIASVTGNVVIKVPTKNTSSDSGTDGSGDSGVVGVAFATDDWDTIKSAIQSGNHPYAIGDTKTITLSNSTTATIRICDLTSGRYQLADNSGSTKAVFEFVDCVGAKMYINNDSTGGRTNVGGYVNTLAPNYLTDTILPMLPSELQNALVNVTIPYCTGNGGTEMSTTTAKLFLASAYEITGDSTNNAGSADGEQFQLQATSSDYRIKHYNGSATYWWTRTPNCVGATDYYGINPTGALQSLGSLGNQGCVPFFAL